MRKGGHAVVQRSVGQDPEEGSGGCRAYVSAVEAWRFTQALAILPVAGGALSCVEFSARPPCQIVAFQRIAAARELCRSLLQQTPSASPRHHAQNEATQRPYDSHHGLAVKPTCEKSCDPPPPVDPPPTTPPVA